MQCKSAANCSTASCSCRQIGTGRGGGGGVGPPLGSVHLSIMISEWRNYKTPEIRWLLADPVETPLKERNMNE